MVLYLFLQIISSSYLLIMCVCVRFHLNGGIPWSGNWYLRRIGLKRVGSEIISNNTGTKIPFFLTFILKRIFISFSLSIHFKGNLLNYNNPLFDWCVSLIMLLYLFDICCHKENVDTTEPKLCHHQENVYCYPVKKQDFISI